MERRLVRREDTISFNRSYVSLPTSLEIATPGVFTPILAVTITPKSQPIITILASASLAMVDPEGYGLVRITWTQGGLTHVIGESEGKVLPLGGEEYHREAVVTGLTLGDTVGITLEGTPRGGTVLVDKATLYTEEW